MNLIFGSKKKDPATLIKTLKESLISIEKAKSTEKIAEDISKQLGQIKVILYGEPDSEPNPELGNQVANEILANELIPLIINNLAKLEFEAKKDVAYIFSNILRKTKGDRFPTAEYFCNNSEILNSLVLGYKSTDIAFQCGSILRDCARHETLTKLVLYSPNFTLFFDFVEDANFDLGSDAFSTFKELITKHKSLTADFLEKNYDNVFQLYTKLLNSSNYVVRRQSLKLLGELLLDRSNFNVMSRYISDQNNLKLMMNLLRDTRKSIQYESFHVFKVFVANPNKTKEVLNILIKNKDKLVQFLTNFQTDNEEDQFVDEKAFLIKQIKQLPDRPE